MGDINAPHYATQHLGKDAVSDTLAKLKENKNGKHLSKSSVVWPENQTSTDEKHKEIQSQAGHHFERGVHHKVVE